MRLRRSRRRVAELRIVTALIVGGCLFLGGCYDEMKRYTTVEQPSGGDTRNGARLIEQYGCGSCHIVPGIPGADGLVGPPLNKLARRVYLAGVLRNSPDNLMAWLQNPQAFAPGNAMPVMGINSNQARDIAAYLYTLR
jgi:cytochrome c2